MAMDWVGTALKVAEQVLILLNTHEARKDRDKLLSLREKYYAEKNKADPNMAELDDLEHRIFLFCNAVTAPAPGGQAAKAAP